MLKSDPENLNLLVRRALGALGGLYGASGVALAAVATHRAGGETLATAANFLLFNAAPLLALSLSRASRSALAGGLALALGALLFSGDLALRALAGVVVWRLAAPTGGIILIAAWLWLSVSAAMGRASV